MMLSTLIIGCAAALSAGEVISLDCGAAVWDVAAHDLNGDGRTDLAAFCADPNADPAVKELVLFFADEQGRYSTTPITRLPVDVRVGTAFFANVDGEGPVELVAAHAEGATIYGNTDGVIGVREDLIHMSLFPSYTSEPSFLHDAAFDVDNDGVDEWLAPFPGGYRLRNANEELASLRCDVNSTIRRGSALYINNRFPDYDTFDVEGQSTKTLAFLSDEYADFAYGPDWAQHKRFKIPVQLGDNWDRTAKMHDIDRDGVPDLVVTQTSGTINLKALSQVYLASGPMEYPSEPTATFNSKGSFAAPMLKDIDGDEDLDLVFINIPFGVRFFVNYFVWQKLTARIDIHLFDEGKFPSKPNYSTTLSIDAPDGKELVAYELGDYNGDGYLDAAFGEGRDRLHIHHGVKGEFVASKPSESYDVHAFGIARTRDLNGNDSDDLIIYHPGIDNSERIEVILF
jgi:hypothetical protein